MWVKAFLLGCLLLFCLVPCFSQDTNTTNSLSSIEQLKELFRFILTNTDASQEDLLTLDSLFLNWENEIKQLPKLQEQAYNLSEKNGELSRTNFWLTAGIIVAGVIVVGETTYLIMAK